MLVRVVEVQKQWVIIEYDDVSGLLQRKYIPKSLMDVSIKGLYNVTDELISYGVEYSDVDLSDSLGENYNDVDISELQDNLRRRGFWKKEDYVRHSDKLNGVLLLYKGILKLNTLFNASQY